MPPMQQKQTQFEIRSRGKGLYDFTGDVARWVAGSGIRDGLLTLFVRHTSASLVIQENADPDVLRDLEAFLSRLVPEHDPLYSHTLEGPDDMPAHVRAALTQTQLSIPVSGGAPVLGTWQGIYLFEHRRAGHARQVVGHLIGE
jgi:secondary thiamine-phosphate synthase enzyme